MDNKLNVDEQLESMESIKEFHKALNEDEYNFKVKALVLDKEEDEFHEFPEMSITFGKNPNHWTVSINWEDYDLEDFRDYNLLGQYWSTTTRIVYQKRQLILKHQNSDKTVILY